MDSVMHVIPSQQELDTAVEALTTALIQAVAVRNGVTVTQVNDIPRGFFRTMTRMAMALADGRAFDTARREALQSLEDEIEVFGPEWQLCRKAIDTFADRLMALGGRS